MTFTRSVDDDRPRPDPCQADGMVLLFDVDCGFCQWTVEWILRRAQVPVGPPATFWIRAPARSG